MVNILKPIMKVLRMVDGDKKPTMGDIYESIRLMKETIKAVAPNRHVGFIKIIDERWMKMFHYPLHIASKLLYFVKVIFM